MDCYSYKFGTPAQDKKIGGRDDIINKKSTVSNNITTVTFERLLNTNDKYDTVINLENTMDIALAWLPNANFSYHKNNVVFITLSYDRKTKELIFTKQGD